MHIIANNQCQQLSKTTQLHWCLYAPKKIYAEKLRNLLKDMEQEVEELMLADIKCVHFALEIHFLVIYANKTDCKNIRMSIYSITPFYNNIIINVHHRYW